jgi:hypothetical protein
MHVYTVSMHSQTLHMRPLLVCGDIVSGPKCKHWYPYKIVVSLILILLKFPQSHDLITFD